MNVLKKKDFINRKVIVSNHAVKRWNQRVERKWTRDRIINYLKDKNTTIKHEYKGYYSIDEDIIIYVIFNTDNILIKTIYGRRSNIPALNNIRVYHNTRWKYGKVAL